MIWYIEILFNVVINADCLKRTFIKRSFIHADTIKPLLRLLLHVEGIVGSKTDSSSSHVVNWIAEIYGQLDGNWMEPDKWVKGKGSAGLWRGFSYFIEVEPPSEPLWCSDVRFAFLTWRRLEREPCGLWGAQAAASVASVRNSQGQCGWSRWSKGERWRRWELERQSQWAGPGLLALTLKEILSKGPLSLM